MRKTENASLHAHSYSSRYSKEGFAPHVNITMHANLVLFPLLLTIMARVHKESTG